MYKRADVVLKYMIEDCEDIIEFTKNIKDEAEFSKNSLYKKAVTQSLLNLGELTKHLENFFDLSLVDINWKGLKGLRERAAHNYHRLDSKIIWSVATNNIPYLYEHLQHLAQQHMIESN